MTTYLESRIKDGFHVNCVLLTQHLHGQKTICQVKLYLGYHK